MSKKKEFSETQSHLIDQQKRLNFLKNVTIKTKNNFGAAMSSKFDPNILEVYNQFLDGIESQKKIQQDIISEVQQQANAKRKNLTEAMHKRKTLEILKEQNPYSELGQKTSWLTEELKSIAHIAGVPIQTQSMGGMFGFFFSDKPVKNYQDALNTDTEMFISFFKSMLEQGIYLPPSQFESLFVSTFHSDEDLEKTSLAFRKALMG